MLENSMVDGKRRDGVRERRQPGMKKREASNKTEGARPKEPNRRETAYVLPRVGKHNAGVLLLQKGKVLAIALVQDNHDSVILVCERNGK